MNHFSKQLTFNYLLEILSQPFESKKYAYSIELETFLPKTAFSRLDNRFNTS